MKLFVGGAFPDVIRVGDEIYSQKDSSFVALNPEWLFGENRGYIGTNPQDPLYLSEPGVIPAGFVYNLLDQYGEKTKMLEEWMNVNGLSPESFCEGSRIQPISYWDNVRFKFPLGIYRFHVSRLNNVFFKPIKIIFGPKGTLQDLEQQKMSINPTSSYPNPFLIEMKYDLESNRGVRLFERVYLGDQNSENSRLIGKLLMNSNRD